MRNGFSLIELMVVVAIIAILASFAIPQYEAFQAKSRRQESMSLMGAYFSAAQATKAEIGYFPGNFPAVGFNPTGQIHYQINVADFRNPPVGYPTNSLCTSTSGTCSGWAKWTPVVAGMPGGVFYGSLPCGDCNVETTEDYFNMCASAYIRRNGIPDTWSMDSRKLFKNHCNGLLIDDGTIPLSFKPLTGPFDMP